MTNAKEAAERLRRAAANNFIDYPTDLQMLFDALANDRQILAEAYLSEHAADDDELINTDRLQSIGFRHKGPQYSAYEFVTKGSLITIDYLVRFECIKIGERGLPHIKTMGQLRRLIAALTDKRGE